jgi:hypothetical protein
MRAIRTSGRAFDGNRKIESDATCITMSALANSMTAVREGRVQAKP